MFPDKLHGEFLVAGAEDHEDLHRLSADAREIGFADVFVIDKDVLGASHGIAWCSPDSAEVLGNSVDRSRHG